jgi:hypothetical protein
MSRWKLVDLPDSSDVGIVADVVALPGTVVAVAAGGAAGEHGIAWSSTTAARPGRASRSPGTRAASDGR